MIVQTNNLIALITNNDDDVYCFRKELLEAFVQNGYSLIVSCPDGDKFELLKDIPFYHDKPDIDRRGTNPVKDLKLFIHYWRLLKKHRPAIVLTYTAKPNVYASLAARLLGIPYICNVTGLGSVRKKGFLMKAFIMRLFRLAYRRAACVMFQNTDNQRFAEENDMVNGPSCLIPGSGVDIERFPLQPYPAGGDGDTGEPVVFNYIGRILHDKRVDDYLKAARIIKSRHPLTVFNLLGFIEPTEQQYKEKLKQMEEEGIVNYYGNQKDIRPFIAKSHATIHPSTYGEGMSNVLLESASSGRPLITTDNPGCQETVQPEKTGFIFHGRDVQQLCDTIERFLKLDNREREAMGKAGREYVAANFDRWIVIDTYLKQIKEILSNA